jgi:hypothetical protein
MSNNDQQLVDHLYNAIFVQQLRCDHFNLAGHQTSNSVWNKHADEKKILDNMIEQYKKYYKDKVMVLKTQLNDIKEVNVNSYLTYDTEYYISEYTQRVEELDKYLVELEAKSFDHIAKDNLSYISEAINYQFPEYSTYPTLLGQLC